MKANSLLDLIGNTPLVNISAMSPNPRVEIWAKLEGANPTGSVKDRIAWHMVQHAEAEGILKPGATILEPSSGNTGIALAMIGAARGYRVILTMPVKIVMPDAVSPERVQLLEAFGAEIILSPGADGSNGAVRMATRIRDENPGWVMLFQYENEMNLLVF